MLESCRLRSIRRLILTSAAALSIAGPALAQGGRHSFNIPAQDAVLALQSFARQSGKQVLFPFEPA
jgi:iron complex outermembrane receptor protein